MFWVCEPDLGAARKIFAGVTAHRGEQNGGKYLLSPLAAGDRSWGKGQWHHLAAQPGFGERENIDTRL